MTDDEKLTTEWFQLLFRKIKLAVVGVAYNIKPVWAWSHEAILVLAGKCCPRTE